MGITQAHHELFFSCPEDRVDDVLGAARTAIVAHGCNWTGALDDPDDSFHAQAGDQYLLRYDHRDTHTDGPARDIQAALPDITFRYVEAGLSWS